MRGSLADSDDRAVHRGCGVKLRRLLHRRRLLHADDAEWLLRSERWTHRHALLERSGSGLPDRFHADARGRHTDPDRDQ